MGITIVRAMIQTTRSGDFGSVHLWAVTELGARGWATLILMEVWRARCHADEHAGDEQGHEHQRGEQDRQE